MFFWIAQVLQINFKEVFEKRLGVIIDVFNILA